MFAILNKRYKMNLPIDIQLELFDKVIEPTLLYGCEVWGACNFERIEIFHRNFLRRCLKLGKSTSICMLYGETGRRHLKCTIEKRMINYWLKILAQKDNKITKLLYNYILNMHDNKIQTTAWLDGIKSILDRCGRSDIWLNSREITATTIIGNQISQKINDMWLQWWHSEV